MEIHKKRINIILIVESLLGVLFYFIFRPEIKFFSMFNLKLSPIIKYYDNILVNSTPSFISSMIAFTFVYRLFINQNNNLYIINLNVIFIGILIEFGQLFFPVKTTFDYWDIIFTIVGSIFTWLLIIVFEKNHSISQFNKSNQQCFRDKCSRGVSK